MERTAGVTIGRARAGNQKLKRRNAGKECRSKSKEKEQKRKSRERKDMDQTFEKRKKVIYDFICDDFYVPMKIKGKYLNWFRLADIGEILIPKLQKHI